MGLPERIKASIAARDRKHTENKTDDKPNPTSAKASTPNETGLPPFKEPKIPKGYRAVLIACSETGRASWAVLKANPNRTYSFARNVRAVPDPKATRTKASATGPAPAGQQATDDTGSSELPADIPMEKVYLGGFTCGCCGADGSAGSLVVLCRACNTLQCRPQKTWHCPGCGKYIETVQGTIDSVSGTEGSQSTQNTRGGLASGPRREAITSAAPATTDKAKAKKRRGQ